MTEASIRPAAEMMSQIRDLARTRIHRLAPDMTGSKPLTYAQMSRIIQVLEKCPLRASADVSRETAPAPAPAAPAPSAESQVPPRLSHFKNFPAGYYATPSRTREGEIDYWLVTPGTGKWEGLSFARRVLGGDPGDRKLRSVSIDNMQQRLALQAITAYGLQASQALFAETLTRCLDCSAPLTDAQSRAAMRGPVCRARH